MISIIVPVYKTSATVRATVDSLVKQTYKDWEIILVDDGSPDNSGAICDAIVSEAVLSDYRIRVVHQQNKGLYGARNTGIQNSRGEYLCFVDSDDVVEEDYLCSLLESVDDETLTICGIKSICGEDIIPDTFREAKKYNRPYQNRDFLVLFETGLINSACNKLYSTKVIRNNSLRFEKIAVAEDIAFNIEYIRYINHVAVTTKSPYHYIKDNSSLTTKVSSEMFDNYISLHKKLYCLISEDDHSIVDRFIFHQYFSFIIKYMRKVNGGQLEAEDTYRILKKYHNNEYIKKSFASYRPSVYGEYLLYIPCRYGWFRLLKWIISVL